MFIFIETLPSQYAFLSSGGDGNEYYRWVLFASVYGLDPATQPAPPAGQPHPAIAALPEELRAGFSACLGALSASAESIQGAQAWFMAGASHARGLAALLSQRARALLQGQLPAPPDGVFGKCLQLVYLCNDVLFAAQRLRPPSVLANWRADGVAAALAEELPSLLACCYASALQEGGGAPAVGSERVPTMIAFWRDKLVFDSATATQLHAAMMTGNPYAALAAGTPYAAQPSAPLVAPPQAPQGLQVPAPFGVGMGPFGQPLHGTAQPGRVQHPFPGGAHPPFGAWPPSGMPPGYGAASYAPQQPQYLQQPAGAAPPSYSAAAPAPSQPQPPQPQPPQPPAPDPAFPPGLIPELVRKSNRGVPGVCSYPLRSRPLPGSLHTTGSDPLSAGILAHQPAGHPGGATARHAG